MSNNTSFHAPENRLRGETQVFVRTKVGRAWHRVRPGHFQIWHPLCGSVRKLQITGEKKKQKYPPKNGYCKHCLGLDKKARREE